jgi:hypothetical protein
MRPIVSMPRQPNDGPISVQSLPFVAASSLMIGANLCCVRRFKSIACAAPPVVFALSLLAGTHIYPPSLAFQERYFIYKSLNAQNMHKFVT